MFRRNRDGRRAHVQPTPVGTYAQVVATAYPDTPVRERERALCLQLGRQLQGHSGTVVGYDRGDPAHSITTVFEAPTSPSAALARIGMRDHYKLSPEVYDIATTDPELTAYQTTLLQRTGR